MIYENENIKKVVAELKENEKVSLQGCFDRFKHIIKVGHIPKLINLVRRAGFIKYIKERGSTWIQKK